MSETIYKEARSALKNLYDPLRITESGNLVDVPRPRLVVKKALDYAEKQDKFIQKLKENLISGHFEDKLEHTNEDGSSEDNMYNKGLYDMVNAIESYVLQEIKELENEQINL